MLAKKVEEEKKQLKMEELKYKHFTKVCPRVFVLVIG